MRPDFPGLSHLETKVSAYKYVRAGMPLHLSCLTFVWQALKRCLQTQRLDFAYDADTGNFAMEQAIATHWLNVYCSTQLLLRIQSLCGFLQISFSGNIFEPCIRTKNCVRTQGGEELSSFRTHADSVKQNPAWPGSPEPRGEWEGTPLLREKF